MEIFLLSVVKGLFRGLLAPCILVEHHDGESLTQRGFSIHTEHSCNRSRKKNTYPSVIYLLQLCPTSQRNFRHTKTEPSAWIKNSTYEFTWYVSYTKHKMFLEPKNFCLDSQDVAKETEWENYQKKQEKKSRNDFPHWMTKNSMMLMVQKRVPLCPWDPLRTMK